MFRKLTFVFLSLLLSMPLHAQEAVDYRDVVQIMYVAYYGRPGDEGGIHFWAKKLDEEGGNLDAIIVEFGESDEFQFWFGDLDAPALVNNIFVQLLGREADDGGLAFYVKEMEEGRITLPQIAKAVADGAQNLDITTVANKLAVANEFTEAYLVANVEYKENQIVGAKQLMANVDSTSASVTAAQNELPFLLDTFPAGGALRVRLETQYGDIVLEMYLDEAPLTVANFLNYVDADFYDGTVFHRLAAGFVLQGGGFVYDPEASCPLVQKETMSPITNEASNGLSNVIYTVAMARTNDPDSATSQFYINLKDNTSLDFSANSAGYAVFATVIDGQEVVKLLATAPTITLQCLNSSEVPQFVLEVTAARRAP